LCDSWNFEIIGVGGTRSTSAVIRTDAEIRLEPDYKSSDTFKIIISTTMGHCGLKLNQLGSNSSTMTCWLEETTN